jgi:uncharacterized protein YfaA (DUF2138 family)
VRIDMRSGWVRWGTPYVLVVSSLVVIEQVTGDGRFYLAAVLLTLPVGLAAVVGVYAAYGFAVQLVTALSSGASESQITDRTFLVTGPINVALFAGAAICNVLMLRSLLARRRA